MFPMVIPNSSEEGTDSSRAHQADLGTLNSMIQNSNASTTPQLKIKKKRNLPGNPGDCVVSENPDDGEQIRVRDLQQGLSEGSEPPAPPERAQSAVEAEAEEQQGESEEGLRLPGAVVPPPPPVPGAGRPHRNQEALLPETRREEVEVRKMLQDLRRSVRLESPLQNLRNSRVSMRLWNPLLQLHMHSRPTVCMKDSFITHRAFCDALAEESARLSAATNSILPPQNPNFTTTTQPYLFTPQNLLPFRNPWGPLPQNPNPINLSERAFPFGNFQAGAPPLSATVLLQKAATMGATGNVGSTMAHLDMHKTSDGLTRDFLGLTGDQCSGGVRELQLPLVKVSAFHNSLLNHHGFGWGNC
ncbi:hypothetical protein SASPL_137664 [Salvia splendens]|uniref:BIRD-IDD transcription factor fourth C2HC zinc finger domain-containing protein n=1 Tax=Salvia splendens TaxID=180675 RepID=A0A8X8WTS4_SALSN|nr:hypothetical protein SASPL_137664 [Salvia splendens]